MSERVRELVGERVRELVGELGGELVGEARQMRGERRSEAAGELRVLPGRLEQQPVRSADGAARAEVLPTTTTPAIAVLVSGGGTNLQAIIDAIDRKRLLCHIAVVISDRPGVKALERAADVGIPTTVVDRKMYRRAVSEAIDRVVPEDVELLVLAGFLSIVREPLLSRFKGRIINLHPALLPKFGGPGMYGRHVHRAVLDAGERESGCTVHLVDEGTDTGPILMQRRVPVLPEDSEETLATRISVEEHIAIVDAIDDILRVKA